VEDRERAVGVVVDPHPHLDEVRPDRARRDLQAQAPVAHAVVVAHHPLFVHAQDVAVRARRVGDERTSRLLGRDREAAVVFFGQVDLAQEAVGGLGRGDAGECRLLGQRRSCGVPKARSERPRASGE
jgi:hypothetical protein